MELEGGARSFNACCASLGSSIVLPGARSVAGGEGSALAGAEAPLWGHVAGGQVVLWQGFLAALGMQRPGQAEP